MHASLSFSRVLHSLHAKATIHMQHWPDALRVAHPVMHDSAEVRSAIAAVFSSSGSFRIHLDETCAPRDWQSQRWTRTLHEKYGAEVAIPIGLAKSSFVTSDWQRATASLVVLYVQSRGGALRAPEACRRKLQRSSSAWKATNGSRHFFVLTQDYGPCSMHGQLLSPWLLAHHVIAVHGELDGHHVHVGPAPDLPCFDSAKDISIPPPIMLHPPPTDPPPHHAARRNLTLFFSGAGLLGKGKREGRWLLHKTWGDRWDPQMVVLRASTREQMLRGMRHARFCPVFGGNSPWTTRLVEAIWNGCVPVIISTWLPPFSRVLRWEQFSVRLNSLAEIPRLKAILQTHDHERLAANLRLVPSTLWYRRGDYGNDDALPMLLVEMVLALRAASTHPLKTHAVQRLGMPIEHAVYYDDDPVPDGRLRQLVGASRQLFPRSYKGGVTIVTNRSYARVGRPEHSPEVMRCVPVMGPGHSCAHDPWASDYDPDDDNSSRATEKCKFVKEAFCKYAMQAPSGHRRESLQFLSNQSWRTGMPPFMHDGKAKAEAMAIERAAHIHKRPLPSPQPLLTARGLGPALSL